MAESGINRKFHLLIPAYNIAPYIGELLTKVSDYFDASRIIVVDDGSTDETAFIARSFGVNLIVHPTNYGKGVALKSGFAHFLATDGEWVMTIDGDLQHSPDKIPEFIAKASEGSYDVIIGTRLSELDTMPLDRRFSNLTTSKILSLVTRDDIRDSQCGFRIINRRMVEGLSQLPGIRFEFETECILNWSRRSARIGWVPVPTMYHGSSSSINRIFDTMLFCKVTACHLVKNLISH